MQACSRDTDRGNSSQTANLATKLTAMQLDSHIAFSYIISRRTKKSLHVKSVSDPSTANINRYKTFKQIYQRRAAKKLSIAEQLRENASNPKKTWQTLNEILGRKGKSESVSDIRINDEVINDSNRMANHFNSFFTIVWAKKSLILSNL
jgi:hypothetical protein